MSINPVAFEGHQVEPAIAKKPNGDGGALIKRWRERRHLSQKELANAAGVSCRHISFVETGRSRASRKMVLRLCEVLDLPYRSRNSVLEASGFEPAFTESSATEERFKGFGLVLDNILGRNEPFPSVVLDGHWNIVKTNEAGRKLLAFLNGGNLRGVNSEPNLIRWLIDAPDLRAAVTNWNEVAVELVRKLHKKIEADGADRVAQSLLEGLIDTIETEALAKSGGEQENSLMVPVNIRKSGMTMSFLGSSLEFEAPKDITVQELRVATLHPLCKETEEALRFLAISRL